MVINIDKETERFFIEKIQSVFPDHHILGEEGEGDKLTSLDGVVWIIDPIDGTITLFIKNAILRFQSAFLKPRDRFIYDVTHDELYHAFQGEGAYMNNTKLGKMKEVPLEDLFWPSMRHGSPRTDASIGAYYPRLSGASEGPVDTVQRL